MPSSRQINLLTHQIIGCAIAVHKELGPGVLEKHYAEAMYYELEHQGIPYEKEVPVRLYYRGKSLGRPMFLDLPVAETVIVEMKAVDQLLPVHEAQLLSYLSLAKKTIGLLMNFHEVRLVDGIHRLILPGANL